MADPIVITSDSPILNLLKFRPYRNMVQRKVTPFSPLAAQPQTMEVVTPWGVPLIAKKGDLLVSEIDKPDDIWPVDADVFDKTYLIIRPGVCVKRALTYLVPLTELTHADADRLVTVVSMDGQEAVRAGDFFLARGVKGEIWVYPKDKVDVIMKPVD